MNIIIPMAGMGKRMRPHTLTTPKPLIPIAGKPMVQRIVEDILATCNEPIEHIGFVCGRFGEEAEQNLLDTATRLGAKGHIFYQDTPLGTAHAILCASQILTGHTFIAFADTLFDAQFTLDTSKDAIIWTQKVDDPSAFGVVTLDEQNKIIEFVEKPKTFVSDLAIIGVYYFRDGDRLRRECQRLVDERIMDGNEYQLTTAMANLKRDGMEFYSDQVREWLDCGNVENVLNTNKRILNLKKDKEILRHPQSIIKNSIIIEPCFIGENAEISDSVVGPNVSVEAGAKIHSSIVKDSIIRKNAQLNDANLTKSLIGESASIQGKPNSMSLSDFTTCS